MGILSAGKYWIGDPCYVLGRKTTKFDWNEFCNFCFDGDPSGRKNEGVVTHQGITFAFYGTAHGDGGYYDLAGNEYGVDAGLLACIPLESIPNATEEEMDLGHIHEFEDEFETSYRDGLISFGHVNIDTEFKDMYDEEDDY